MRTLRKNISILTSITVIAMVLFGIFCPQISMQKMEHSSCSGSAKMFHISSAEVGGCLGLHSKADNLPSIIPDSAFYLLALTVLLLVLSFSGLTKERFAEIYFLILSRLRFITQFYDLTIKPLLLQNFLVWRSLNTEHIPAVNF